MGKKEDLIKKLKDEIKILRHRLHLAKDYIKELGSQLQQVTEQGRQLAHRIARLKHLIQHIYIHANMAHTYEKMDGEMRALYDLVIDQELEELHAELESTAAPQPSPAPAEEPPESRFFTEPRDNWRSVDVVERVEGGSFVIARFSETNGDPFIRASDYAAHLNGKSKLHATIHEQAAEIERLKAEAERVQSVRDRLDAELYESTTRLPHCCGDEGWRLATCNQRVLMAIEWGKQILPAITRMRWLLQDMGYDEGTKLEAGPGLALGRIASLREEIATRDETIASLRSQLQQATEQGERQGFFIEVAEGSYRKCAELIEQGLRFSAIDMRHQQSGATRAVFIPSARLAAPQPSPAPAEEPAEEPPPARTKGH